MPILETLAASSLKGYGFGLATETSAYTLIDSQVIGAGGASNITFSSIPSTYYHLELRYIAKNTDTGTNNGVSWLLKPNNNVTTTDYLVAGIYGQRLGADDFQDLTTPGSPGQWPWWNINTSKAGYSNWFGSGNVFIFDYANSNKHKTVIMQGGFHWDVNSQISYQVQFYEQNTAISSLTVAPSDNNWAEYTKFSLYGVK